MVALKRVRYNSDDSQLKHRLATLSMLLGPHRLNEPEPPAPNVST